MMSVRIVAGFPEGQRRRVAELFWDAFASKLGRVLGPQRRALPFIESCLTPAFALSALDAEGRVLGVAGFKTGAGGLISADFRSVARAYGWAGALWRSPLLDLTERRLAPGQLLADGIFVAPEARGRGIGHLLLGALQAEAARRGCHEIRLDVIDSNPRARALYERAGYRAVGEERLGLLRHIFGFRHATTMVRAVLPADSPGEAGETGPDAARPRP